MTAPPTLSKVAFTADSIRLPEVQTFTCGTAIYETEISNWIKLTDGALKEIAEGTQVWLYYYNEDLVGYGSLCAARWKLPSEFASQLPINLIPAVGVQTAFHGKPEGPPQRRFASQIVNHLKFEAASRTDRLPLLGLFVHPQNDKAIRFYRREGFLEYDEVFDFGFKNDVVYPAMIMKLKPAT